MPMLPTDPKELGYYFALAQVGLEMVLPIGIGLALDHYLNWSPWGVVGGAIFGLVAGIAHLIAIVNRYQNDGSSRQRRDSP